MFHLMQSNLSLNWNINEKLFSEFVYNNAADKDGF
jgi:hypothetical protein